MARSRTGSLDSPVWAALRRGRSQGRDSFLYDLTPMRVLVEFADEILGSSGGVGAVGAGRNRRPAALLSFSVAECVSLAVVALTPHWVEFWPGVLCRVVEGDRVLSSGSSCRDLVFEVVWVRGAIVEMTTTRDQSASVYPDEVLLGAIRELRGSPETVTLEDFVADFMVGRSAMGSGWEAYVGLLFGANHSRVLSAVSMTPGK